MSAGLTVHFSIPLLIVLICLTGLCELGKAEGSSQACGDMEKEEAR